MPLLRLPMPRLPVRHVFRAFRELDPYSDEQCRRFVAAARGSIRRRFFTTALIGLTLLIGIAAGIAVFWFVQSSYLAQHRTLNIGHSLITWYGWLLNIALGIVGFAVGPILGYLTRDFLLIRRVRHILRTRGVCFSCRYTLVGLFVADDLNVTCPECGTTTKVDPALGELVTDETGRPRFKPDETRHKARRFFTERRVKRIKRAAPWVAAFVIGFPLILAGGYEVFLRWQAGVAQRGSPGPNALSDLVLSRQPPGSRPSDPNAWHLFDRAVRLKHDLDLAIWAGPDAKWFEPDSSGGPAIMPEYTWIHNPSELASMEIGFADDGRLAHYQKQAEIAHAMMDAIEQTEVFDLLEQIANAPRDDRNYDWHTGAPGQFNGNHLSADARALAQMSAARMRLAPRSGEPDTYLQSARAGLALASLHMRQPVLLDYLVGVGMESRILSQVVSNLQEGLPEAWLVELAALLDAHEQRATHDAWLEGERLVALHSIAWAFGTPSNVRFGRWSMAMSGLGITRGRIGTYRENVRILEKHFDTFTQWQGLAIRDRALPVSSDRHPALVSETQFGYSKHLITIDGQSRLALAGTRAMVALERHRSEHGDYPVTLQELIPAFLETVPIDPWSGGPLGYVRVDPATDPLGRHYLLYSTGSDFEDNGGRVNADLRFSRQVLQVPSKPDTHGYDFIVNDPH